MQLVPHHESWKKTKKKVSNYSWKLYYKKLRPNERPEECETKITFNIGIEIQRAQPPPFKDENSTK